MVDGILCMNASPESTPRPRAAVIGSGACGPEVAQLARELGALLAEAGVDIVCGGLGGVMEAVCQGAKMAGGATIGILPVEDRNRANPYVDVAVATPLSHMRNYLVVLNGDAVIAVEGGAGTLSELALAWKSGKVVVALGRLTQLKDLTELGPIKPARTPREAVDLFLDALPGLPRQG